MNNKEKLIEQLANIIEEYLISIGDDIKGLSWFSSIAKEYNLNK